MFEIYLFSCVAICIINIIILWPDKKLDRAHSYTVIIIFDNSHTAFKYLPEIRRLRMLRIHHRTGPRSLMLRVNSFMNRTELSVMQIFNCQSAHTTSDLLIRIFENKFFDWITHRPYQRHSSLFAVFANKIGQHERMDRSHQITQPTPIHLHTEHSQHLAIMSSSNYTYIRICIPVCVDRVNKIRSVKTNYCD